LIKFLEPHFAKWWLPDAVEFASEIPRTSAGKFLKTALREKYGDYYERALATNGDQPRAAGGTSKPAQKK
jgi:fatty-acyl-CoA synthase